MSLFARLTHNSLWLLFARVGAQVSSVLVIYLLARRLSVTGFGEYSFIVATIMIGNTLTTFGSDMYLIREIAANAGFFRLPSALILQLFLSCVYIGVISWLAPHFPNQDPESILALRIYSFALIPLAFFTTFTSALRGGQKMASYASLNLLTSVVQVVAIYTLVQRGTDLIRLAYVSVSIQIAGAVTGGITCAVNFPNFWKNFRFSFVETIDLFIACIPIALIASLGILYQKLSITMLSLVGSASMAGWFSAATRVIEAARIGHISILTAIYPAMANAKEKQDSLEIFKISWILLLVVSGAATLLVFFLARPIVNIFFGMEYQTSISILRILSFTIIPYAINSYLTLELLVEKEAKTLIQVLLVSLIMLSLFNLWLIPRAGGIGASWSFLIAESIQAFLLFGHWKLYPFHVPKSFFPDKGASNELSNLS